MAKPDEVNLRPRRLGGPRGTARERLLDAAEELFATQGFAGTTTQAIRERAGTSAGVIFYHFHSKEGLLDALLRERSPQARVEEILDQYRSDPRRGLSELATYMLAVAEEREPMLRILMRGDDPHTREVFRERLSVAIDIIAGYLVESVGGLSQRQARTMAQTFMTALVLAKLLVPTPNPEAFAEDLIDILLYGPTT